MLAHYSWAMSSAVILCSFGPWAKSDEPGQEGLYATLVRAWESLDTLEFRCEEYEVDSGGLRADDRPTMVTDIARASGGRSSFRLTSVRPDGTRTIVADTRQDGKREYQLVRLPDHPDVVNALLIKNQQGGDDAYDGIMNAALWLLMPGGKPIHAYARDGESVGTAPAASGVPAVIVRFRHDGHEVRCELNPQRDWLPSKIEMPEQKWSVVVTKYFRDNGRWFPEEGFQTGLPLPGGNRRVFRILNLRINRPVADDAFGKPRVNEGVMIADEARGRSEPVGASEARKRFLAKFGRSAAVANEAAVDGPTWAPRTVWGSTRGLVMLAAGSCILVGVLARFRRVWSRGS
jgi:hypothetical protein